MLKFYKKKDQDYTKEMKINISLTSSHFLHQKPDFCATSAGSRAGRHPHYFQLSSRGILCKQQ